MSQFRKKPVVIEAAEVDVLLWCAARDWDGLPAWMIVAYEAGDVLFLRDAIEIKTLEGTMRGDRGDWIIQGVKGEFYPCKPDIFAATYEPVSGSPLDPEGPPAAGDGQEPWHRPSLPPTPSGSAPT